MRYAFIAEHCSQWPIVIQCKVLQASRAGFYAWCRGNVGVRKTEDEVLKTLILEVHESTGHTYGADSIAKELRKGGKSIGKARVLRLMKAMSLKVQCKQTYKLHGTTNSAGTHSPSPDLVQRQFKRTELNEVWLSDFTELPSIGQKIYAVAIKDQASHRVLGVLVSNSLHTGTLITAFYKALHARNLLNRPPDEKIIFHSDQGGQYNSNSFKDLLDKHGFLSSMGSSGDCYDNAPMESFWATMKTEIMHHFPFRDVQQASAVIYKWVYLFYNQRRRHTSIGGLSPMEYEAQYFRRRRETNVA